MSYVFKPLLLLLYETSHYKANYRALLYINSCLLLYALDVHGISSVFFRFLILQHKNLSLSKNRSNNNNIIIIIIIIFIIIVVNLKCFVLDEKLFALYNRYAMLSSRSSTYTYTSLQHDILKY